MKVCIRPCKTPLTPLAKVTALYTKEVAPELAARLLRVSLAYVEMVYAEIAHQSRGKPLPPLVQCRGRTSQPPKPTLSQLDGEWGVNGNTVGNDVFMFSPANSYI